MTELIVAVGVLLVLTLLGWIVMQVRAQQHRLGARLDELAVRLSNRPAVDRERSKVLDALKGERAPGFSLPTIGGERVTLDALLAPAKPLLLVFVEPRCGPCYELLPDIGGWQRVYGDQLAIELISAGDARTNLAMTAEYGIRQVILQHEMELVMAYDLAQAPAAVLIQPDGRISDGPRYGTRAVRQLVADALGLALPAGPDHNFLVSGPGDEAPALRLPDLDGNVVDLESYRGAPTLLLFWSPGCSYCREILPEVLAYEQRPNRARIVVVSSGPIGLNQALGFTSPVVLDEARTIGSVLGVTGTPAAVLIDGMGRIASPVGRGTAGVRAFLASTIVSAATVAE